MTTTSPDVTITITETSTVFQGLANVYRYDRPSAVEVAHYLRNLLGPQPHNAHVHIVSNDEQFQLIGQALADYDVTLTHEDPQGRHALPDSHPAEESWEEQTVEIIRPSEPRDGQRSSWVVAGVVATVAVICGIVIWAVVSALGGTQPLEEGVDVTDTLPAPRDAPAEEEGISEPVASSAPPEPKTVVVAQDGLMLEVPVGFQVERDGEMWRATGSDPNFRLQMSVDNLYQLPPEELIDQILIEIEQDPLVELVDNSSGVLTYHEDNADGSRALWRTWVEAGHQLSVGCHSRYEPTTVQQATCRMAMDSASFDDEYAP